MHVLFDARELYFLTQYLPVERELSERGVECGFVAYQDRSGSDRLRQAFAATGRTIHWTKSKESGLDLYRDMAPDWAVFGRSYAYCANLPAHTRTALLYHGIGMKSDVYKEGLGDFDVRFVEGPHYQRELQRRFPDQELVPVGYAKIDPLFWPDERGSRCDLQAAGLDPSRPTIMYAPTHAPSSFGKMSPDWPRDFAPYNLILKPHMLSYTGSAKKRHRQLMELWRGAPNVYVCSVDEWDPIPFMRTSDLLISDASSVLFEFAATDRPVVWCDFLDVGFFHSGLFSYRLGKRLDSTIDVYRDVGAHAPHYRSLRSVVDAELADPARHAAGRQRATQSLIGETDGRVSVRVADYLMHEFELAGNPSA